MGGFVKSGTEAITVGSGEEFSESEEHIGMTGNPLSSEFF